VHFQVSTFPRKKALPRKCLAVGFHFFQDSFIQQDLFQNEIRLFGEKHSYIEDTKM